MENIRQAINFIEKRIKVEFVIESVKRKEILQFPTEAYRESIINALIHRDYFDSSSDITVESYRNKIIIYSPGGLVRWLKIDEFGKISKTRNKIIASLLSRTVYVERMGTGIPRIKKAMKGQGLAEPIFEHYEHSFYVHLMDKQYLSDEENEPLNEEKGPLKGEKEPLKGEKGPLNEEKGPLKGEKGPLNEILVIIKSYPGVSQKMVIDRLGKDRGTIRKRMAKLIKDNMIERRGSKKTGGYYLKGDGVDDEK